LGTFLDRFPARSSCCVLCVRDHGVQGIIECGL
jgi:hypothetical protein